MSWIIPSLKHGNSFNRNHALYSWGDDVNYGSGRAGAAASALMVTSGGQSNWKEVSAYNHTIGITWLGKMYGSGSRTYGRFGDGATSGNYSSITQIGSDSDWKYVSCGLLHSFAIKNNGKIYATGINYDGRLGLGDSTNRSAWSVIGAQTDWKAVYTRYKHTIGVKDNGKIYSWGRNAEGQLGIGNTSARNSPVQIGSSSGWTSISVGLKHSAGIRDGKLYVWGINSFYQIGGFRGDRSAPFQIGADTNWAKVACGKYHTFAVKQDGSCYCTGTNYYAALCYNGGPQLVGFTYVNLYASFEEIIDVSTWYHLTILNCRSVEGSSGTVRVRNMIRTCGKNVSPPTAYYRGIIGQGANDFAYYAYPVDPFAAGTGSIKIWAGARHGFVIKHKGVTQ